VVRQVAWQPYEHGPALEDCALGTDEARIDEDRRKIACAFSSSGGWGGSAGVGLSSLLTVYNFFSYSVSPITRRCTTARDANRSDETQRPAAFGGGAGGVVAVFCGADDNTDGSRRSGCRREASGSPASDPIHGEALENVCVKYRSTMMALQLWAVSIGSPVAPVS
jgi:hypothetical protein